MADLMERAAKAATAELLPTVAAVLAMAVDEDADRDSRIAAAWALVSFSARLLREAKAAPRGKSLRM